MALLNTEYNPNIDEPLKEVTPVNLEITVRKTLSSLTDVAIIYLSQPMSGQHFILLGKKTVSMEIQYETYGIPHDCEKKKITIDCVSDYLTSYVAT